MKTWKIILLIIVAGGLLAAILGYVFVYNKAHRDYERARPDMALSASELYQAFAINEKEAEETFINKVLLIDGTLAGVEQPADDMVVLSFVFAEGFFGGEGVRCTMLPSQHDRALQLSAGDQVVVKGLCTGFTGTDVILEHSSFESETIR